MAEGNNMNVVQPPLSHISHVSPQLHSRFPVDFRVFMRKKIYAILQHKYLAITDVSAQERVIKLTKSLELQLMILAKSQEDYLDLRTLEFRIDSLLRELKRRTSSQRRACPPPISLGMSLSHGRDQPLMPSESMPTSSRPNHFVLNATFQPGSLLPPICRTGDVGYDLQRQQTAGANECMPSNLDHHMADVCKPNIHQITGLGTTRNSLPLARISQELTGSTDLQTISKPFVEPNAAHMHRYSVGNVDSFGSSNLYGVVTSSGSMEVTHDTVSLNPNSPLRADAAFTSNQSNLQGMQKTSLPQHQLLHQLENKSFQSSSAVKENLAQVNQQPLDHGFHQKANDIEHYGQQSQQIYPGQLQKQDHLLLNGDAYRTQLAMGLVTPIKHVPSLELYKEALQQQLNDVKQIRWILFMFHARDCKATEGKCESRFCSNVKKVLEHAHCCKVPDCTYQLCRQSRVLILHYKNCKDKNCVVCVSVRNYRKKEKARTVLLHGSKCSSASIKCPPTESFESMQAYNKGVAEVPFVDDYLQPSIKRLKIEQPSQNAIVETESNSMSVCGIIYKSHPSMANQGKDGMQSDECKSIRTEVIPMDIDVSDASGISVTQEMEKHVAEDIPKGRDGGEFAMGDKSVCLSAQGNSKCMNEMDTTKEESMKQSLEVVDVSKMEISSLVELFTTEQVKEHIRGLRQWVGQSKIKADKNKAMGHYMTVNSCQLCAIEKLVFEPIPIYCSPCGTRIKRNALHYSFVARESRQYVCSPCYNGTHENSVSIDGTPISKSRLEKKKNDEQVEEGWVQCDKCLAWQHQICALFNGRKNHGEATKYTCPSCYIREVEEGERRPLPESAIPGAKSLPVTTLSNHLEQRLFKKLKKERQERARLQGKSYNEVPGAESLAVRVVASVDKVLEVKKHFFELFREENYPSEFPYKSKVILLFQKIESVEVCLFGMFVQEFGTESGPPNQRRVYLSYLDSVKYFRPEVRTVSGEALRTFVYHEILIGYLDYCKKRGFTSCYIWACPPLKGDDYILYCHPEIQKTPKTDKLREWYLTMLRKASKEDVVVECTNLYDQFFVQSGESRANVTAARLPYFDGDYWPGAAEDLIQQMSKDDDVGKTLNRKGFTKKVISKRALRAVGQLDLPLNASKDRLTMQKLGEIICPLKEDFIMVHLQHSCKHCYTLMVSGNRWVCKRCKDFQLCDKCNEAEQKRVEKERHPTNQKEKHTLYPVGIKDVPIKIEDKDENIESEFFDNRQAFLNLCQGNNYQYDTLRRAKHSSMMLLFHLHNPSVSAFATTCMICQQEFENAQGWRCEVCPGYDVCNACYSKASIDHPHNLISRSSAMDAVVQQNGKASQNYQIQLEKLKERLLHVSACQHTQCEYEGCERMKILFKHCRGCKTTASGGCPLCMTFWRVIRLHARNCRDSKCTVPKCRDVREISSRKQQQTEKRRRAAVMEMMRERTAEANTHTR
ncbi:unnamed protein product [Cochlearia groenlandica]